MPRAPKRATVSVSLHPDPLITLETECKRYRHTIDEVAAEYVCPITGELPLDPVTADDGRCYERWAIEEWFERQEEIKSPMTNEPMFTKRLLPAVQVRNTLKRLVLGLGLAHVTNEPMGKRLLPAVQVRNTLKHLVQSGAITGSKADAWKKAIADEEEVAALRVKAGGGDAVAMRTLGFSYQLALHGLKKDATQAFTWLKKAADLNERLAVIGCACAYLNGEGVERSNSRGVAMLGIASVLGSEAACCFLGQANAEALWGFNKDPQEATRWYREMQKCTSNDATPSRRDAAVAWLLAADA
jgi:hypothetical protein